MPTNFPTGVDNFTNPTANDSLNLPSHSTQHANANDAIEAIEAKLGVGNADPVAMYHVITKTFTATTSLAMDNVFSSAYENYKIIVRLIGSTSTTVSLQMRKSGTADGTGIYQYGTLYVVFNGGTGTNATPAGTSTSIQMLDGVAGGTSTGSLIFDMIAPNLAVEGNCHWTGVDSNNGRFAFGTARILSTNTFDGFQLFKPSGNMTGSLSIYGYRSTPVTA